MSDLGDLTAKLCYSYRCTDYEETEDKCTIFNHDIFNTIKHMRGFKIT